MHIQLNFIIEFFFIWFITLQQSKDWPSYFDARVPALRTSHTISLILTAQVQNGEITQLGFSWLQMMQWLPNIGWIDISNVCERAEMSL